MKYREIMQALLNGKPIPYWRSSEAPHPLRVCGVMMKDGKLRVRLMTGGYGHWHTFNGKTEIIEPK
jgi:hypothetical protein